MSGVAEALDVVALANLKAQQQTQTDLNLGIQAAMQGDANLLAGRNALSGAAVALDAKAKEAREKEEKRNFEDRLQQMLLDRLHFHEDRMRDTADRLRRVYGEDIVGGLAAKYLTPEQIANARSEEEIMLELKSVMLDSEGHIRPEYAGSDDALYVYDWNQTRELRSELDELPTASPERKQEIYQGIREEDNVTLNHERAALQRDEEATQVAEATLSTNHDRHNEIRSPQTPIAFG